MVGELRWCSKCNVPLLGHYCSKCGLAGVTLRLRPRADPRPAFESDFSVIKEALANEYFDGAADVVRDDRFTVLVRLPYLDQAYEVIQDGAPIGRAFFDLYTLTWRFKPLREGARRLWEEHGVGAVVHDDLLSEGELLDESDFNLAFGAEPDCFVPLVVRDEVSGLGKLLDGGLLVLKVWETAEPASGRRSTFRDAVEANERAIVTAEARACKFVADLQSRFRIPHVASYSGGKDSLATLLIALQAGVEPELFFNDTGLELPETVENVAVVADKLGLKLITAEAGRKFWEYFWTLGPPARDYRWCCKVCKLIPTSKAFSLYTHGALALVGQRRFESSARARSPSVWKNYWIKGIVAASPIRDWTMLQVWLYLGATRGINLVNAAYFEGLDRIGCYMCPACRVAEFEVIKRMHPDMWSEWERALLKWATQRNLPRSWVAYHLWRWARLPQRVASFASDVGLSKEIIGRAGHRVSARVIQVKYSGLSAEIIFDARVPLGILCAMAPPIGDARAGGSLVEIQGSRFTAQVSEDGFAYVEADSGIELRAAVTAVAKLVARSLLCRGCGSCANWCPSKAISMVLERPVIDKRVCIRCGRCMEKCPVTAFYAPLLARDLARFAAGTCSAN